MMNNNINIINNSSNNNSRSTNGSLRESLVGGRNIPMGSQYYRRGHNVTGGGGFSKNNNGTDENLDLFSKNRRGLSVSSDESSDVSVKLERLAVGSAKFARSGIDDLLSSTEGGKHDYDWLLTPPGTPLSPSSEGSESKPTSVAPRSSSLARSTSTTKAVSRLSVSQSESYHSSRPTRSSSVTRPSISSSQYSTYSSNRSSSILNTSSASVSSYTRPSSPITRTPPVARPSTPPARPTPSRSSTPSRVRPAPTSSSVDKTPPSQNSRPSTPRSRGQSPANFSAAPTRSNSRPSTPTRRNPAPSSFAASSPSTSAGRVLSNGRIPGPASRPSSPSPRVRPPQQPVIPPDFPPDTPPNLRTTLQGRPLSAGRSRTGVSSAMKGNPETMGSLNAPRRHSSPIVTRGRLTEPSGKGRVHSNGHVADTPEPRKFSHVSEVGIRRPVKSSSAASDSTGFGRTISKKSLDMAIRHMDIRNGTGSARSLSSTTLFPQSIRSTTPKSQSVRSRSTQESINNGNSQNGDVLDNEIHFSRAAEIGHEANDGRYSAKLSDVDIYESSRYDAILLEDLKNTNWLHSIDDKSDQGPFFDNGSESLPEPFGLL
ncbi:flocculation protein FLO11-like [Populus nigra]|uniref:flocculation protein FLO11-like n=1 Tax=Populus nigra TaxID=3691 RepID=UPI002B2655B4|nr:flocculation protein FLO11-like [Populus nigra]